MSLSFAFKETLDVVLCVEESTSGEAATLAFSFAFTFALAFGLSAFTDSMENLLTSARPRLLQRA